MTVAEKAKANELHFRVDVSGWRNSRAVIVKNDTAALEVARISCSHCATCASRIQHVTRALHGSKYSTEYQGGGMFIIVPLPKRVPRDQESISAFLGQIMNLRLYAYS